MGCGIWRAADAGFRSTPWAVAERIWLTASYAAKATQSSPETIAWRQEMAKPT